MELTLIKIPGKEKRDQGKAAVAARKSLKRPPGRPLKPCIAKDVLPMDSAATTTTRVLKRRSLKNIKSKRKMSLLEKLPTELMETIFYHCLNLELPRSSPVIVGKLSSTSVFTRIVLIAFGPAWTEWHGRARDRRTQKAASGVDLTLQSAILRCRWATLDTLLDTKDAWLLKFEQDRDLTPICDAVSEGSKMPVLPKLSARKRFERDFVGFCDLAQEIDGSRALDPYLWERTADLSDGVEIPETLLLGPWTEDMIKYLFWLATSGATIDWIHSTAGEVALSGLKIAILEGDTRAVILLLWAGLLEKLDIDTLIFAIQNAGDNKQAIVDHILRLGFSDLSDSDARKLGRALAQLRDEAVEDSDQMKLEFFEAIRNSNTLRDVPHLHV